MIDPRKVGKGVCVWYKFLRLSTLGNILSSAYPSRARLGSDSSDRQMIGTEMLPRRRILELSCSRSLALRLFSISWRRILAYTIFGYRNGYRKQVPVWVEGPGIGAILRYLAVDVLGSGTEQSVDMSNSSSHVKNS